MFGGRKQGGGGSEFVTLTGLFKTKSGKGLVGNVKPEAFDTLMKMMEDADEAGTELVFYVGSPRGDSEKVAATLAVTVGKPRQETAPSGSRFARKNPGTSSRRGETGAGVGIEAALSRGSDKQNPPKDPLDDFLEDFNGN